MPDFNIFFGEDDHSILEYVSQFNVQCSDASHAEVKVVSLIIIQDRLHMIHVSTGQFRHSLFTFGSIVVAVLSKLVID